MQPLALAAVDAAEARFRARIADDRLELFRLRLQATVTVVTPLAGDLAESQGSSLDEVSALLRPMFFDFAPRTHLIDERTGRAKVMPGTSARISGLRISRLIARRGVVLPALPGRADRLGFVPTNASLECAGWLDRCWVCTSRSLAHLLVPGELPDSAYASCLGRDIGEVVDHPTLAGRGYIVRRVVPLPNLGAVFTFKVGLVPHCMPWEDLLVRELERRP